MHTERRIASLESCPVTFDILCAMTYIVCRMDHPSGQVAQLDSFGTEDAAKMCLANVVEEALAERDYLKSEDVRELLDRAVRELRLGTWGGTDPGEYVAVNMSPLADIDAGRRLHAILRRGLWYNTRHVSDLCR